MPDKYPPKPNKGVLFPRYEKDTDSHPDLTGSLFLDGEVLEAAIAGEELRIAAWRNKSKSGNAYWSLTFSKQRPRQDRGERAPPKPSRPPEQQSIPGGGDFNDDIPF